MSKGTMKGKTAAAQTLKIEKKKLLVSNFSDNKQNHGHDLNSPGIFRIIFLRENFKMIIDLENKRAGTNIHSYQAQASKNTRWRIKALNNAINEHEF